MNQHSSIVVHTTKYNKKLDRYEPIKTIASLQFPIAFERGEDAEYLRTVSTATVDMVNYCSACIKEYMFKPFNFRVGDKFRAMTLFELFAPHKKLGVDPETGVVGDISWNGKPVNISINGYPSREIFNKKNALVGVDSAQIIELLSKKITELVGEQVTVPISYVNEVIFNQVDTVVKGYILRKLNKCASGKDSTWSDCCFAAGQEYGETNNEEEIIRKQLAVVGIQASQFADHGYPVIPEKWTTKMTYKMVDKRFPLPRPENVDKFNMAYKFAFEMFMKEFTERFPVIKKTSLMKCPVSVIDVDHVDYDRYYDTQVKLTNLPSCEKCGTIKLRMRTRSGHSTNYYPESLKDAVKKVPQVNIRFPEGAMAQDMCLPDSCTAPARNNAFAMIATERPSWEIEFNEEVFENEGVGIDINLAEFLFNTTLKPSEIADYVDFVEALATFHKERPDNVIFTDKGPDRLVREIKYIVNHAHDKNRTAAFVLLAGVRDGNICSDLHNWHPAKDFLSTFFKWMLDRKNADGSPMYNDIQRKFINMTRSIRNDIRYIMTLIHRRKVEQSRWDRTHDPLKEKFFDTEFAIQNLAEFNKRTNNLEQSIQQIIAESLINRLPNERSQFYAMEDVNLNEIRNDSHVVGLYRTAQKDWGMTGGKLSIDKPNNTVTFVSKDPTVKPDIDSTEYWTVKTVAIVGDTTTVVTEPTERFVRQVIQDQVDGSLKKILRISGYKHFIEDRCLKLGKLMTSVNPKHTSQLCHVCQDAKRIAKKADKHSKEACTQKQLNFRDGRVFICGNPECSVHGIEQNADENAAFNILYKSYAKK